MSTWALRSCLAGCTRSFTATFPRSGPDDIMRCGSPKAQALEALEILQTMSGAESRWDDRIARARELAAEYSPAAQILTFYAGVAVYQRSLIQSCDPPGVTSDFVHTVDVGAASAAVPDFLE